MIDLYKFCDKEMPWMKEPFNRGEYSYGCNGHIIVRVPLRSDVTGKIPDQINFDKLEFDASSCVNDIPDYPHPPMSTCQSCKGLGKSTACVECEAEGYVELDSGFNIYEAECKTCRGNCFKPGGDDVCWTCEGKGKVYNDLSSGVSIGDDEYGISVVLLDKIKALPNVKIGKLNGEKSLVPFRFDGGEGLVAPILLR